MARPPSTYDGRTSTGYPILSAAPTASSRLVAVPFSRWRVPRPRAIASKRPRSSAMSISSGCVPRMGTSALRSLALLVVAAVQVRSSGWEFTCAGVDHLVSRDNPEADSPSARGCLDFSAQVAELSVGKSHSLHSPQNVLVDSPERRKGFL